MRKKTIVYIGSLALPDGNAAASRANVIGRMLNDFGYEVIIIGANRDINNSIPILETRCVVDGFESYTNPRRDFLISIKSIVRVLEAVGPESIAAVIAVNYPAFPLYNLLNYCTRKNISLIAECTEWYAANIGNWAYRALKWIDIQLRMRYVCKKIHHVICISRFLENYYRQSGCHTLYLPGLVDRQASKWTIESHRYPGTERQFVYAGSPEKKDDITALLRAFYDIMQQGLSFKFHVFGISKEIFADRNRGYEDVLEKLSQHVFFHGRIPHSAVISYIKGADFTVFIREKNRVTEAGFPTKFVESLACGIPVITNQTSDLAEYLVNGETGFLVENNEREKIKAALLHAIELDEHQLNGMKEACYAYEKFDYRRYTATTRKYIDDIVRHPE